MTKTKLKISLIALLMLAIIAAGFILKDQFEPGLWTFWFIAFNGTLAIYAGTNVAQKKVMQNDKTKTKG